jgi:hypothetical protein
MYASFAIDPAGGDRLRDGLTICLKNRAPRYRLSGSGYGPDLLPPRRLACGVDQTATAGVTCLEMQPRRYRLTRRRIGSQIELHGSCSKCACPNKLRRSGLFHRARRWKSAREKDPTNFSSRIEPLSFRADFVIGNVPHACARCAGPGSGIGRTSKDRSRNRYQPAHR